MGIKMSTKHSLEICDGYVKYEKAEVHRLLTIMKTNDRAAQ